MREYLSQNQIPEIEKITKEIENKKNPQEEQEETLEVAEKFTQQEQGLFEKLQGKTKKIALLLTCMTAFTLGEYSSPKVSEAQMGGDPFKKMDQNFKQEIKKNKDKFKQFENKANQDMQENKKEFYEKSGISEEESEEKDKKFFQEQQKDISDTFKNSEAPHWEAKYDNLRVEDEFGVWEVIEQDGRKLFKVTLKKPYQFKGHNFDFIERDINEIVTAKIIQLFYNDNHAYIQNLSWVEWGPGRKGSRTTDEEMSYYVVDLNEIRINGKHLINQDNHDNNLKKK